MRILVFFLFSLILLSNSVKGQVNVQDSLALVDLYNSTNGNGWTIKTNWLSNQPVATWYGVLTNNNRVSSIDLNNNNLTGTIPATLGNLLYLLSLQLDVNQLSGSIPASLGNLVNLQYLSLILNQLTGPVPASLGNMTSLGWMRLADNQLSGSIPSSLGNLSNLQYFYLGDNRFTGTIPASLGNLTNLLFLQLYINQLTGPIPSSLGNLSNLVDLELTLNQLSGPIPSSLGNLSNLSTLALQENQLSGPIPASLGNLNFYNLFIGYNYFTFDGMELIAQQSAVQKAYAPQGIIPVSISCGKLSVSVGGTPANNTYRWYNDVGVLQATVVADSTFTPSVAGNFYVVVSNSIAIQLLLHSDTLYGNVSKKTVNASICDGQFYALPSGKQVNTTGTFNDTLKSVSGCGDSLITILNLVVSTLSTYNSTRTICGGQYYTLPSGININTPGVYHDTLRSVLGCDSIITTIILNVDNSVQQMKDSLVICPGIPSVVLNAGNFSNTYSWNTGSTSNTITVSSQGLYSVIVHGINGCKAYDTFMVIPKNAPHILLDKNIVLCNGQPKLIDAGGGYQRYLWNTGSSSRSITIQSTGLYWVTISDQFNCSATDSTDVNQSANPPSGFLPPDTAICSYTDIAIGPASKFEKYLWNTSETSGTIVVKQPGVYSLFVTDINNCVGTDSITINKKQCVEGLFVPNAFTPNGDGVNDILRPVNLNNINLSKFDFTIFNRWGQRVFESTNPSQGWDGKINGSQQNFGTYVWMLNYQFQGGPPTNEKGIVVLIR